MTKQEASVLFETISFFFVAIDLYGTERIEKTHLTIVNASQHLSDWITTIKNMDWNKRRRAKFMKYIYWINGITALLIMYQIVKGEGFPHLKKIVAFAFLAAILFAFTLLPLLLAIVILIGMTSLMIEVIRFICWVLMKLLKATRLEGLLLFLGTLLFLVSKYLQLY